MSELTKLLYTYRRRKSRYDRADMLEEFCSDKSRIVFCSSFRRMMQKAQVFSLESNSSVRNRLTHSLEVADIGRTVARAVGRRLQSVGKLDAREIPVIEAIVENACLLHDIGNPPFGHFGEEAIKGWFRTKGLTLINRKLGSMLLDDIVVDFINFDGNPQGFRIATRLHNDLDDFGLNLTAASLLATIKYPNQAAPDRKFPLKKKMGIFSSEREIYQDLCKETGHNPDRRYFLVYLTELADDICYCLSDIADSFEKNITTSREFKEDFKRICDAASIDSQAILPKGPITSFSMQVAIALSRRMIEECSEHFVAHLEDFLDGKRPDLAEAVATGKLLDCLKQFTRKHVYTHPEAQRIEIAGHTIVTGLLDHYARLLEVPRDDFKHFVERDEMRKHAGLDLEWRIFKQLSPRMIKCYSSQSRSASSEVDELICRARLLVDQVSGLTDSSALKVYQTFSGIRLS